MIWAETLIISKTADLKVRVINKLFLKKVSTLCKKSIKYSIVPYTKKTPTVILMCTQEYRLFKTMKGLFLCQSIHSISNSKLCKIITQELEGRGSYLKSMASHPGKWQFGRTVIKSLEL